MNLIEQIKEAFQANLQTLFSLDQQAISLISFELNVDPAKQQFGDINSNAAMILAKQLKQNPREVAQKIAESFTHEQVEKLEIAGPGFLNFYLKPEAFQELVGQLLEQKKDFFKLAKDTPKQNFNIEFVSANPTGPLHLGHGRGGILGDVLANILQFLGHQATREYYINDAGAQIQKLARSFKARCEQAAGKDVPMPEDGYQGEYLVELAQETVTQKGPKIIEEPEEFFGNYAQVKMLEQIAKTLSNYGITFDVWFSEKKLHTSGAIDAAFKILDKRGFLYEKDDALWFKSTEFGDDKDRVVKKSSGDLTYVASDIAYMENKVERGFDHLIMILGHDHHSYAVRLEGLRQALGIKAPLDVILFQLVKMKSSGQQVRMSKRTGNIVTLEGVIEAVGKDVARFFYLNRKADAQLEFDLDLALKKTEENPVYYVQYAYVRIGSILEKARALPELQNIGPTDTKNLATPEHTLIKKIISLKQLLENIGGNYQTHLLTYYVLELANAFHSYYSKNRVIVTEKPEQSRARLLLMTQLRDVFGLCLDLLGISKPTKM